jgi:hypothetical protein
LERSLVTAIATRDMSTMKKWCALGLGLCLTAYV